MKTSTPRTLTTLLCVCFAAGVHAKLGETVPQLITRFGKNYTLEEAPNGKKYKFRSAKLSVDVLLMGGISVGETYFSDHPLNEEGEPPNEIVRAILHTNVPGARWFETLSAPNWADYAIQSADGKFVALLGYSRPQPENAKWTMVIGRRDAVAAIVPRVEMPAPSPPASPGASVFPPFVPRYTQPAPVPSTSPGSGTSLIPSITEAKRREYETAIADLTKRIANNPSDAQALADRGSNYTLLDEYDKAIADYEAALKIRPNDQNIQVRLQSAKALRASGVTTRKRTVVEATPPKSRATSPPATVRQAQTRLKHSGSLIMPIFALAGTGVIYALLLARAFQRRTLRWIGAAGAAAILFGLVCVLFMDLIIERKKSADRSALSQPPKQDSSSFDLNSIANDKELARFSREQGDAYTQKRQEVGVLHVAEQIQRGVVRVAGVSTTGQFVGSGTGFFVSADGNLMTCWHVVAPPQVSQLRLMRHDGSQCDVEGVVGFSARDDWVLLKTKANAVDFLPLRATTAEKPAFGTRVLVFGNPGQLSGVWSEGAVADFVFNVKGTGHDSLRFDAPVAPGSSGSPVVDRNKGDVIGIATATGWPAGNYAAPYYYITDGVAAIVGSFPISLADLKEKLEKEKPAIKQQIYDKEIAGDFTEAEALCAEYSVRYPGDVWGSWELTQIAFATDDYRMANVYGTWLQPAKDPGDDMLAAMKFECADFFSWWPGQKEFRKNVSELLKKDYDVEIFAVQMPAEIPVQVVNVREKPDAKSNIVYQFDPDEHVFAKQDRARNLGGKEDVIWRKVLVLPSRERLHGGEGWVNERYISPVKTPDA